MSSTVLGKKPNSSLFQWTARLQHAGLAPLAAAFLEAGSPLTLLAAQGLYLCEPLLETWLPRESLHALAEALEDEGSTAALARSLREGRQ